MILSCIEFIKHNAILVEPFKRCLKPESRCRSFSKPEMQDFSWRKLHQDSSWQIPIVPCWETRREIGKKKSTSKRIMADMAKISQRLPRWLKLKENFQNNRVEKHEGKRNEIEWLTKIGILEDQRRWSKFQQIQIKEDQKFDDLGETNYVPEFTQWF